MSQDDPRHNARVITLQRLFERAFPVDDIDKQKEFEFSISSLTEIDELDVVDEELAEKLFNGVISQKERIDSIIEKLAPQWPISQIAKSDLQILRIAIFEGFIEKITPEKVAIDEAIELAKDFTNEQSRKFINGALGNLIINKDSFDI